MEQLLSGFVALVLVSLCKGQDWTPPDFCNGQICPQYKVVEKKQDFEVRSYVATDWITTKVKSSGSSDLMTAHSNLKHYCQRQKEAGYVIPVNTWPVLFTTTQGSGLFMSWFVPPGTKKPADTDPSVKLRSRPETTYYVRVFNGVPSIERGKENAALLREALVKAGKTFDRQSYTGAGYDSYFSPEHHSEIWIPAA